MTLESLRTDELEILQHSLGLDKYGLYRGERQGYRNYFAADPEGADYDTCESLVRKDLMFQHPPREWSDFIVFSVTELGRSVVAEQSPPAPKLTRSQKRYRQFLSHDNGMTFHEWLSAGYGKD